MAPGIRNTQYIPKVTDTYMKAAPVYKGFLKKIATHVLVHVRI